MTEKHRLNDCAYQIVVEVDELSRFARTLLYAPEFDEEYKVKEWHRIDWQQLEAAVKQLKIVRSAIEQSITRAP